MDTRKFLKSSFIKGADIPGPTVATVASCELAQNKHTGGEQILVKFSDFEPSKALGLNATNHRALANICGSFDTDDWIGTTIELYTVDEPMASDGLGVRLRKAKSAAATSDGGFDDDIPF